MTLEEFTETLETFGCDASNWPDETRTSCEALLASDSQAQQIIQQQQLLERLLLKLEAPDFTELEARILNQTLPPQNMTFTDKLIEWLLPQEFGIQLWRPVVAACFPLIFGILVGNFFSFGVSEQDVQLEYWDDELALLSFNDYSIEPNEPGL